MLKPDQIKECQSKFNLSYHVNYANICQDLVGFENLDVLEVGGSLPPDFVFDYLGAKSWTAIEFHTVTLNLWISSVIYSSKLEN